MNIQITNLHKKYGNDTVLQIPSLCIGNGEIVGLVGNNGAGKTTMMRLILDLIDASDGYVELDGEKVSESEDWKRRTGSFLDDTFLIDFLTPDEYFQLTADLYGVKYDEKQFHGTYESFTNDQIFGQKKLIHDFSMGNRQKIGIMGAMLTNPDLLILDEPFNFLDPTSQIMTERLIREFNRDYHSTILLSSHNLNSIKEVCTRIILIEKGKLIMDLQHTPGSPCDKVASYFSL